MTSKTRLLTVLGGKQVVPWYLSGGAPMPVAIYEAAGAASYAASKVNLVNPGTYDLTEAAGAVDWTTENGWSVADAKYLLTGITPTGSYSVIVHYSDLNLTSNMGIIGGYSGADGYYIYVADFTYFVNKGNAEAALEAPRYDDGIICMAGNKAYLNGSLVGTIPAMTYDGTDTISIMAVGAINKLSGKVKSVAIYSTQLSAVQVASITSNLRLRYANIQIDTPNQFQIFQRSGVTGTINISGTLYGAVGTIEASFNGAAYSDIATGVTGAFTGSLTGQAQGQGALVIRLKGTTVSTTINYVGIGDVFIVAGQSNASGRGTTTTQSSTHATLKSSIFGNDYQWKNLRTVVDSLGSQVDTVSKDSTAPLGSVWIPIGTAYMAALSIPCAFVPCTMGGTNITAWQPGADHEDRTTLYGSMIYRAKLTGAKAVLWWQGEQDVVEGMAEATYNTNLDSLADAINTDIGVPTIACKLQDLSALAPGYDESAINSAIGTAWADNANVLAGPDLSGITPSVDGVHMKTDAEIADSAALWWTAIAAALYP